jgi:hypothetical protein
MELGRESEPVDLLDLGGGMAGLADGYQLLKHEKLSSVRFGLRSAQRCQRAPMGLPTKL